MNGIMINKLKREVQEVLEKNILHYWMTQMVDDEHGGFYGRRDGDDRLVPNAPKGAVLNARILWAFAAACRVLSENGNELTEDNLQAYKDLALRAKDYILKHFIDREYGGVYWMLDSEGRPVDTKKQTYAIGFMIYGFSELYRATDDEEALQVAIRLFQDIEAHAYDPVNNGYVEALTRDWQPISDMRLSDKDENGSRTMNTHLHILEPYTNLYRVWKDKRLEHQLRNLIHIFTTKILNPRTQHLDLFFDDQWQGKRNIVSYGHDIEAAWLLTEALEVLGDKRLMAETMPIVNRIAHAAEEGLRPCGAMTDEKREGQPMSPLSEEEGGDLVWWVQCECIIGEMNQWQHFGDNEALERALRCWAYTRQHLIDWQHGEWHWSVKENGSVNRNDDKAGPWKCPYHNTRLCLEIIERAQKR